MPPPPPPPPPPPGAGLAQLLALHLASHPGALPALPAPATVIGYGSPPVYTADPTPVLHNVFIVQNNEDGLSGASLRWVWCSLV